MSDETPTDFGKELDEAVEAIRAAKADGHITLDEWPTILSEVLDVVGVAVAASRENPEAVESIKTRLILKLNAIIDNLGDGRILKKSMAKGGVLYLVPWLVDGAAAAEQPDKWLDEKALPLLKQIEDGVHAIRVKLGG